MRKIQRFAILFVASLFFAATAHAHVTVRPSEVGVGKFQTFTVSVPSEKEQATVMLRLLLPDGLESVTPTVKPPWNIEVKKHNFDGAEHPYEIVWSGGSIPAHFRDEFTFSMRAPANETTLAWKAYQTYADKTVVSWDMDPAAEPMKTEDGKSDFSKTGPYSETKVVNDLAPGASGNVPTSVQSVLSSDNTSLIVSSIAFVIALASLVLSFRNRHTP